MKKIISVFCSFVIFFVIITPIVSFAITSEGTDEVALLQKGDYSYQDYDLSALSLSYDKIDEIKTLIYDSLNSFKPNFSVSSYNVTADELAPIYSNVINDNPNLFYVSSTLNYFESNITGYVLTVNPEYSTSSKAEIAKAKEKYEAGVQSVLSIVDNSMSDIQKALVIHDYLCNISTYPDVFVSETSGEIDNKKDKASYHSAYGIFFDGYTVCAGYTLTYSDLMHRLGIPAKYVTSFEMGHAWNVIQIDGNWYNVDLTFDEIQFAHGTNNKATMLHNCFMKSDEGIKSANGLNHYGIIYPNGVSCTDPTYDNYFWNGVNTNIYTYNGDYYYLSYNTSTRAVNIIKRDVNGNSQTINKNKYSSYTLTGNSSGTKFYISFSHLVKIDDILYFSHIVSGNTQIAAINLETGREYSSVLTHNDYNFGLGVQNGIISYSTYGDRYNYIDIDKKDAFNNYYSLNSYSPYADVNKDNYLNAKDYVLLNNQ